MSDKDVHLFLFFSQSSSSLPVPHEHANAFSFDARTHPSNYTRKSFFKKLKKKMDDFLTSEVVVVSGLGKYSINSGMNLVNKN